MACRILYDCVPFPVDWLPLQSSIKRNSHWKIYFSTVRWYNEYTWVAFLKIACINVSCLHTAFTSFIHVNCFSFSRKYLFQTVAIEIDMQVDLLSLIYQTDLSSNQSLSWSLYLLLFFANTMKRSELRRHVNNWFANNNIKQMRLTTIPKNYMFVDAC